MYINLKGKHFVLWTMLLIILIIFIFIIVYITNKVEEGKKILLNDNTLNITSYYAEYEVTVISNKNTNTYSVKEWYKENVGSRIEYLDYMNNIVTVITKKDECYISNSGNKAYILINNIYGTDNVLSLATYLNIFNKEITCNCNKNVYEKDEEINIVYDVCGKDNCMQSDNIKHMGVGRFKLIIRDNTPINYTVYDVNKKEYACILYNRFDINTEILDEIFNIGK